MCRFTGRDDPGYRQVGGELRRVANKLRLELQKSQLKAPEVQAVMSEDSSMYSRSYPALRCYNYIDKRTEKLSSEEIGMGLTICLVSFYSTNPKVECLRTLCVPEIDMWKYNIGQDVQTTCTWLFGLQEYCSWKDTSNLEIKNTLLRVKGKLGTGKSTSIRIAMSRLWNEESKSPGIKLAFFFNSHGNTLEKSQLGLFRSLLFQLLQQSKQVLERFMPIFRRKVDFYDRQWTWSEAELKSFFLSVMTESSLSSAFIFIDALHECDEAREVMTFFESLRISTLQKNIPVKICYSSRHYPPIETGDYAELQIDVHNNDDIENYIELKLKPLLNRRYIDKLKARIIEKAQGVFLWVVLVVSKIVKANDHGESMERMQAMVEDVPDKLESLYRDTLNSVSKTDPAETLLILQWIICATRPITLLELRYALEFQKCRYKSQAEMEDSFSFIESDLQMDLLHRVRTGGLTDTSTYWPIQTEYARQIFDTNSQTTVHLVHDSVRSFLLQHGGFQLLQSGTADDILRQGHKKLAETCINYLDTSELRYVAESYPEADTLGLTKSVELFQQLCRQHPFLIYSLHSVFEHIKAAEPYQGGGKEPPSYLYHRMEEIFFIWRYLCDIESKCRFNEVQGRRTALAHLAAEYGLFEWVQYYISSGGDVNVEGGRFGALLQASAGMGHEEIVNLLLRHGADVHHVSGRLGSALSAAASEGHIAIVKTILQQGADVNDGCSDVNDGCGDYGSALKAAICSPNENIKLVQILLDAGADIHLQGGGFGTALQAAAYKGSEEIVIALLERGADPNVISGTYGTALGAAASQGHEQIVQVLLEHGADLTVEAGNYGNSIWATAYHGQGHIVRKLLRYQWPSWTNDMVEDKAQEIMDQAVRTVAFHQAVEDGDLDLVEELIKNGIDPNVRGCDSSALHAAVAMQHTEIVALLLAHENIKVDVSDSEGRTPLWVAASDGHPEIVKMLLDTGRVNPRHKSGSGRNLLWFAASDGRMDMVRLMLEAGADPFEADDGGTSPIMVAERKGQQDIVSLFRKTGGRNNDQT